MWGFALRSLAKTRQPLKSTNSDCRSSRVPRYNFAVDWGASPRRSRIEGFVCVSTRISMPANQVESPSIPGGATRPVFGRVQLLVDVFHAELCLLCCSWRLRLVCLVVSLWQMTVMSQSMSVMR